MKLQLCINVMRSVVFAFLLQFSCSPSTFANIILIPKDKNKDFDRINYKNSTKPVNLRSHPLIIRNLKELDSEGLNDLSNSGELTEEIVKRNIPSMLTFIKENDLILGKDKVQDLSCYNVIENKNNFGVNTTQLFFIKVCQDCLKENKGLIHNCNPKEDSLFRLGFILKGVKTGLKEIERLHTISLNEISDYGQNLPLLKFEKRNERIILTKDFGDYYYFKNENDKGSVAYFSLLEAAQGKSFYKWVSLYATAKKENDLETLGKLIPILTKMFQRLGSSLSKMHQDFRKESYQYPLLGKTYIHGDLHAENCFYDPIEDQIYLIDNETLAMSFGEKHYEVGIKDISDLYILHSIKTLASLWSKQLTINIDEKWMISDYEWHRFWGFLLESYIESFPKSLQTKKLVAEIERAFLSKMNPPLIPTLFKRDQRELKLLILKKIMWHWLPGTIAAKRKVYLRKNYLKPLFEDLKIKYDKKNKLLSTKVQ